MGYAGWNLGTEKKILGEKWGYLKSIFQLKVIYKSPNRYTHIHTKWHLDKDIYIALVLIVKAVNYIEFQE